MPHNDDPDRPNRPREKETQKTPLEVETLLRKIEASQNPADKKALLREFRKFLDNTDQQLLEEIRNLERRIPDPPRHARRARAGNAGETV